MAFPNLSNTFVITMPAKSFISMLNSSLVNPVGMQGPNWSRNRGSSINENGSACLAHMVAMYCLEDSCAFASTAIRLVAIDAVILLWPEIGTECIYLQCEAGEYLWAKLSHSIHATFPNGWTCSSCCCNISAGPLMSHEGIGHKRHGPRPFSCTSKPRRMPLVSVYCRTEGGERAKR